MWGDQLRVDLLRRWRVEEETYGWDIIHGNPFFLATPCTACAFHQSFSWFFPIWCQRNNLHCFLVGNHIPYLCKTANNHHWFIFYYFSRQRHCVLLPCSWSYHLDSLCFSLAKINRSEYFELRLITVFMSFLSFEKIESTHSILVSSTKHVFIISLPMLWIMEYQVIRRKSAPLRKCIPRQSPRWRTDLCLICFFVSHPVPKRARNLWRSGLQRLLIVIVLESYRLASRPYKPLARHAGKTPDPSTVLFFQPPLQSASETFKQQTITYICAYIYIYKMS